MVVAEIVSRLEGIVTITGATVLVTGLVVAESVLLAVVLMEGKL